MRVIADLHIHSRFARACSKELNARSLDRVARQKGVHIMGTGDVLHPQWRAELKKELEPAELGLFRLRSAEHTTSSVDHTPVNFMLTAEVACIYKQGGKVRRIHHILLFPSFEAVELVVNELEKQGRNLRSDGRPILGLSSIELLKIVRTAGGHLIPAHAWTPWFAIFGSKSGFDSIEECFLDLSSEIFAIETGLSSDPPMNWRLSALDSIALISCSDAHSLPNLAREATEMELPTVSYDAIIEAIINGAPTTRQKIGMEKLSTLPHIISTIEFFPEEGIYHLDGHRTCGVRWEPEETRRHQGKCTKCGLPVTVGVLNRVETLADRNDPVPPAGAPLYHRLVELDKIIAEAFGVVGRASKKVQAEFEQLVVKGETELDILLRHPLKNIAQWTTSDVVEGIRRVRAGELTVSPGYDGLYGKVQIFSAEEKKEHKQSRLL